MFDAYFDKSKVAYFDQSNITIIKLNSGPWLSSTNVNFDKNKRPIILAIQNLTENNSLS